jgi:hypothetical protein
MILSELKSVIAQNCEEYNSYNVLYKTSMGANHISCSNCFNYVKEKCTKGLHDEIKGSL